jgi:hypothetical protein
MPTIQNFALHGWDFPRTGPVTPSRFAFPAGVAAAGGTVRPSETEIGDNELAEIERHPSAKTWFAADGLVVKPAVVSEPAQAESEGGGK